MVGEIRRGMGEHGRRYEKKMDDSGSEMRRVNPHVSKLGNG